MTSHVSRTTIAFTPLLLITGIIAQIILLILVILLFVPLMVYPAMLNGPYRWITGGMGRIMIRAMRGKRGKQARNGTMDVTVSLYDRAVPGASGAARFKLQWI